MEATVAFYIIGYIGNGPKIVTSQCVRATKSVEFLAEVRNCFPWRLIDKYFL